MKEFDYEQLLKATESFSSSRIIGKGSHGWIYKGILEENNSADSNSLMIAVKKSSSGGHEEKSKLENERRVLSSLEECPNVIKFLGTITQKQQDPPNNLLVMEYMPNGSLHHLLHVNPTPPSWSKRMEIALQVAKAVRFLHEETPLVIHRDIKSENVLFDQDWNAKLADFGLAIMIKPNAINSSPSPPPAGTMGYIDPCYTTPSKLSTKVDVFSYGVVLLEILSGRKAIDVSKSPASIVDWAVQLIQEKKFTEVCDKRIEMLPSFYMEGKLKNVLSIAARCVSSRESIRPSMREIVSEMESLCYSIKRVKIIPIWTSLLRTMMLLPKRQKLEDGKCTFSINASKCTEQEVHDSHISREKRMLLLKEVLADVTLR